MPTILKIELLNHHYSANAWGHGHCEGQVDWPPSPWRILRAIVAVAYRSNLKPAQMVQLQQILYPLAQEYPVYYLPESTYIQHRTPRPHVYLGQNADPFKKQQPQLGEQIGGKFLYAAGLALPEDDTAIYVGWGCELGADDRELLQYLCDGLSYLGRAESPAKWDLVAEMPAANTTATEEGNRITAVVQLGLDADQVWEALTATVAGIHRDRKQLVFPGLGYQGYTIAVVPRAHQRPSVQLPTWVRLWVTGKGHRVPIALSQVLCEGLHRALVARCPAEVFTGQVLGQPVRHHRHSFIHGVPDAQTGRWVESIVLSAAMGYSPEAIAAIAACEGVFCGSQMVRLQVADYGQDYPYGGMEWESVSPFFLGRSPAMRNGKPRGLVGDYQKDGPEHQALSYLCYLEQFSLGEGLSYVAGEQGLELWREGVWFATCGVDRFEGAWKWRCDRRQGQRKSAIGFRVRLRFAEFQRGPLCLGYASHYGLGVLLPVRG